MFRRVIGELCHSQQKGCYFSASNSNTSPADLERGKRWYSLIIWAFKNNSFCKHHQRGFYLFNTLLFLLPLLIVSPGKWKSCCKYEIRNKTVILAGKMLMLNTNKLGKPFTLNIFNLIKIIADRICGSFVLFTFSSSLWK